MPRQVQEFAAAAKAGLADMRAELRAQRSDNAPKELRPQTAFDCATPLIPSPLPEVGFVF